MTVPSSVLNGPDGPPAHGTAPSLRPSAPAAPEVMTANHWAKSSVALGALPRQDSAELLSAEAELLLVVGRPPPAWRVSGRLPPVTADASGYYAVRDTLAQYRKPRGLRPSALSTALTLRLDGVEESPPFSIEGGGLPAAVWTMALKR